MPRRGSSPTSRPARLGAVSQRAARKRSASPGQALTRKLPRRRAHSAEANQEQLVGKTGKGRWGQTSQLQVVGSEHLSISLRTCCRPGTLQGPNTNKNELQMQKQRKQGSCHSWHSEKQNAKNDGYLVLSSKEDPCEELCNCKNSKKNWTCKVWICCKNLAHLLTNCYGPPYDL